MKVIFVSGLYPKHLYSYYYKHTKNGALQNAPNVFQWAVVRGLVDNKCDFTVISYPFLPCFLSGYSDMQTKSSLIMYEDKTIGFSPRYCTVPFLKELSIRHSLKKELLQWSKKNKLSPNDRFAIIVYHLYGPVLDAISDLKKKYPNLVFCSIVTDRFLRDSNKINHTGFFKRIQDKINIRSVNDAIRQIDGFVFLAKRMIEFIPEAKGRSIIIEGIAENLSEVPQLYNETSDVRTLLYTGALGIHTSVEYLLKAFHEIPNGNFRLIVCGDGALRQLVVEYSQMDHRIIYKGSIPREEAIRLQKSCTALINPRRPDVPDTPYSFPSKTIEYMLSGTPMIGYRLEGIPEEYFDYYYTIPDDSHEALKDVIINVLSSSDKILHEKALSAYNFITCNKTAKQQIKRLINFLEKC